jgi:hypothetical protein
MVAGAIRAEAAMGVRRGGADSGSGGGAPERRALITVEKRRVH